MESRPFLVDFDPVALDLGLIQIHWYGISYLLAFASCWWLLRKRAHADHWPITPVQAGDLMFWGVVGVVVGGRMGYVLFYALDRWFADPLFPIWLQQGGMSFHGGLIGVLVTMALFARHIGMSFCPWAISSPRWCRWDWLSAVSATSSAASSGAGPATRPGR